MNNLIEEVKNARDIGEEIKKEHSGLETLGDFVREATKALINVRDNNKFASLLLLKCLGEELLKNASEDDLIKKDDLSQLLKSFGEAFYDWNDPIEFSKKISEFGGNYRKLLSHKANPSIESIKQMLFYNPRIDEKSGFSIIYKNLDEKMDLYPDIDLNLTDARYSYKIKKEFVEKIKKAKEKFDLNRLCFIEKRKGPLGALLMLSEIVEKTSTPAFIYRTSYIDNFSRIKGSRPMPGDKVGIVYDLLIGGKGLKEPAQYMRDFYSADVLYGIVFLDFADKEVHDSLKGFGISQVDSIYTYDKFINEIAISKTRTEELHSKERRIFSKWITEDIEL